jgi:hypothetical protein
MVDYVAASGPAHVIDGWAFLGRAVDSALRRDSYSAIFFGYYAELRAAMALLAAEGLGILDSKHPIINAAGSTDFLPKCRAPYGGPNWARTHYVTGPCLKQWATLKRSSQLLDDLVHPEDTRLSDWLTACGRPFPGKAVAKKWLDRWGLDLAALDDDHDARNMVSYRPSEFRRPGVLAMNAVLEFVSQLWRLLEPSPPWRFPVMERHLLRRAMRIGGPAVTVPMIQALGIAAASAQNWATFFAQNDDPLPLIEAEQVTEIEHPRCHLQVISRAALLLFVATGAAARHLRLATYEREYLAFWWRLLAETRGLADQQGSLDAPVDAWADVQSALQDADGWRQANPQGTLWRLRRDHPSVLDELGACDAIAMWGLVP